jgi:Spy/CpxP family protein refolding chaperone
MTNRRGIVIGLLAGASMISGASAFAQSPASDTSADDDIKLLRKDVRSLRKQLIAANLDMTDAEAQQFWPIFDRYTAELVAITDRKYALLQDYAQNYTTMTNEQAESYVKGRAAVEDSIMQLRLKYFPIFRKVLPGKVTALFFQMDWRLGLIMDLQLASQTPLIEP